MARIRGKELWQEKGKEGAREMMGRIRLSDFLRSGEEEWRVTFPIFRRSSCGLR